MYWLLLSWLGCEGSVPPVVLELPAPVAGPSGVAELTYALSFPDASRNRLEVQVEAPRGCGDWWMATWIPGSYLVREFARHVEGVTATGPEGPVPVEKTSKNTWRVGCEGDQPVVLRYRVAAHELSVRTSYVDADGAVLNAPSWAMVPPQQAGALSVQVDAPWPNLHVALPQVDGAYVAADLDALMDAPMVLGTTATQSFIVDGVAHDVVTLGGCGLWTDPKIAADVQRIVEAQRTFWGALPYAEYTFLNVALGGRGGLEHMNSTLLLTDPFAATQDDAYAKWLGLVSHELFHAWNVKRLKPRALVPLDYTQEVYTPDLWVAEGLTSYYDDLLLARAGVLDEAGLLEAISGNIAAVQDTPGRLEQPLSRSSMDAWIEYYRPDEHSVNQAVSYYRKGAVVGWLLDMEIRRATNGSRSLDDVMRTAYARFHDAGYTPEQFRAVVSEVAGQDMGPWLAAAVDGTGELSYTHALASLGLTLTDPEAEDAVGGTSGASFTLRGPRAFVAAVPRQTPAWEAGLMPEDELIAVDGWRVADDLSRLEGMPVGEHTLTVARLGVLRDVPVAFEARPAHATTLVVDPTAPVSARRTRTAWLEGR